MDQQLQEVAAQFSGKLGLAARHLATGEELSLHERLRFPTASMIKIGILLELFRQCERGSLSLEDKLTLHDADKVAGSGILIDLMPGLDLTLQDTAVLMMALSDNTATNMLIELLGREEINEALRSAGMRHTELRHKIDFDLLAKSNDNFAVGTPRDFVELLTRLYRQELLSPESTERMLAIMRIQKYMDRLRRYLPFDPYAEELGREQEVWVASKTGSLPGVCCEAGLIGTPGGVYALAVMTKDGRDPSVHAENEGVMVIARISRMIYDYWVTPSP
jgi:beta-lactamase class A